MAQNRTNNAASRNLANALSNNSSLDYLNLCNCELQEKGFNSILGTLSKNNVLHHLNVNFNVISNHTAPKICDVIATSTFMTALEIGSCSLSETRIKVITDSLLKYNKVPLQCLDISFSKMDILVAGSIANFLSANKYLETLTLCRCNLSEVQFIQLCKSVRNSIKIKHLDLSRNSVTDGVATEVASVINGTLSLQCINLCNCNFQTIGLKIIADALSNITTLKTLIMRGNTISNPDANSIAAVIASNTSLEHVDLSNCTIQEVGRAMITQALQQATKFKHIKINQKHQSLLQANMINRLYNAPFIIRSGELHFS